MHNYLKINVINKQHQKKTLKAFFSAIFYAFFLDKNTQLVLDTKKIQPYKKKFGRINSLWSNKSDFVDFTFCFFRS